MNRPIFSIVTPAYNRLECLKALVEALGAEIAGISAEILIVDDRSEDGTWEWLGAQAWNQRPVRCFRSDRNQGPGPARNIALEHAHGRYFVPIDSDYIPIPGALKRLVEILEQYPDRPMLLLPSIEYPSMQRMDRLTGIQEVTAEDVLFEGRSGEFVSVVNLDWFRERGLRYPDFRSGGEGILWITALRDASALFVDQPLVYYRTDIAGRICTPEYQLQHGKELGEIADRILTLFPQTLDEAGRRAKAKRLMASGTYHLIAGEAGAARKRLRAAMRLGSRMSLAILLASLLGSSAARAAFRLVWPWRMQWRSGQRLKLRTLW